MIHKFRKIFITLINDSNDSKHSSKLTVLVVAALKKKKKEKTGQQTKQTHNLQVIILVFVLDSYLYTIRTVQYEYDKHLRLNMSSMSMILK